MSYWVYLNDDRGTVEVEPHEEGGTYVLGGTPRAELNVTYNYSRHFSVKKELDGKTAGETIPILVDAVRRLGVERDPNYWNPTEGNVGYMASILLCWALQHPDAVWSVS